MRPRPRCGIRGARSPATACSAWIPGHCRFRPPPWSPTRTRGRLGLVAEITAALPAVLLALTADPGPPSGTLAASYDLAVCGSLLLALALADVDRGQRAADAGVVRSGTRMIALAERFGLKNGLQPTMSATRARRVAQDADGPALRRRRVVVRGAWTRTACAPPPGPRCGKTLLQRLMSRRNSARANTYPASASPAHQATAAIPLPPIGPPVSRPRRVSMTGVNGSCAANQRTE